MGFVLIYDTLGKMFSYIPLEKMKSKAFSMARGKYIMRGIYESI
jgi:ASC-1-like (ASCH) protein